MSPRHGLKKNLVPELQIDDCFATGVTRETLLILRKMCNFNVDFSKIFWELRPQTPILGINPPPRRFALPRLARDLRSLHRRLPLIKILATRLMLLLSRFSCAHRSGKN